METVKRMRHQLHAPTDWSLNSVFVAAATKDDLRAMVHVVDGKGQRRYTDDRWPAMKNAWVAAGQAKRKKIGHLFSGGERHYKGFELRLKDIGLLPRGMAAVPGEGCQLDANGNIPRGFIVQMLAYFRAFTEAGYGANMSDKNREAFGKRQGKRVGIGGARVDYFVSRGPGNWYGARSWKNGRPQHLPPGIWMRATHGGKGTALKPIIMFVKRPAYKHYFDLEAIARTTLSRDFDRLFTFNFERIKRKSGE